MSDVTAIATRPMNEVAPAEMSIEAIVAQTQKIQQCMKLIMKKDEHYGIIPGTGTADRPAKPTLLKPGAEKLCLLFRLDPEYDVIKSEETAARISYMVRCSLFHIPTSNRIASGLGSCNSREDKYLRAAPKKCPNCTKETIFKSKDERGGWFCWSKKGGCGRTYKDGDEHIEKQDAGIKDPADLANTILKMACKRALVAAVLNGTAASDFFTQDLEDLTEKAADLSPPKEPTPDPKGAPPAAPSPPTAATISKPPRANTVKHDGTFASHKQVAYLHIMRSKVGGLDVCDKQPCYDGEGKRINPTRGMCQYHKQLAAFKDCDNRPITTSKDLSEAQISNLLERYEAKIKAQAARADETPDLSSVPDSKTIDLASDVDKDELGRALDKSDDPERLANDICDSLRVMSIGDLVTKDRVSKALALAMAHNTTAYEVLRERIASEGA